MRLLQTTLVLILAAGVLPAHQYRAFWLDAFRDGYKNPQQIDQLIADVIQARCNAVFVQVRHRGGTYYLQSLEPPAEDATWAKGFDVLSYLIEKAHANRIEVHAWFPVYPLWPLARPPLDPRHVWHTHGPSARGNEMWMDVAADGRIGASFDPGHPDAMRYLTDVMVDPIRHYGLDGIHLDYVRYPEDADYGYNPLSLERYRRLTGVAQAAANQPAWSDFRRRQVTELVRQTYLRAVAIRPSIKVSAALISWGNGPASDAGFLVTDAYRRVFQDWRSWMEEGILDIGMPMNYFRESTNGAFLTNWLEFEKDRAYRRSIMPGLGVYLNPVSASLEQLRRAVGPSARGNRPTGVAFYSYATSNLQGANGLPLEPNSSFYEAMGNAFNEDLEVSELPWKLQPLTGHIAGRLTVTGSNWLADGATIRIESDGQFASIVREISTDGSGFFGAVDLAPGRYAIRLLRGDQEIFRTAAREVVRGRVTEFELTLNADDFASILPNLTDPNANGRWTPGDLVSVTGVRLARQFSAAQAVPLPFDLSGTQVLINGIAAPLLSTAPERVEFQLPYGPVSQYEVRIRRNGLDSNAIVLTAVRARPQIHGVHPVSNALEIFATGLGAVTLPIAAGTAADPSRPLPMTQERVQVRLLDASGRAMDLDPFYSGLAPWQVGRYQVNVLIPEQFPASAVQLVVAGQVSAAYPLQ